LFSSLILDCFGVNDPAIPAMMDSTASLLFQATVKYSRRFPRRTRSGRLIEIVIAKIPLSSDDLGMCWLSETSFGLGSC
jgi:hypothetical protein